jgi:hypothetical protein
VRVVQRRQQGSRDCLMWVHGGEGSVERGAVCCVRGLLHDQDTFSAVQLHLYITVSGTVRCSCIAASWATAVGGTRQHSQGSPQCEHKTRAATLR